MNNRAEKGSGSEFNYGSGNGYTKRYKTPPQTKVS
jgi:hypothetical protein